MRLFKIIKHCICNFNRLIMNYCTKALYKVGVIRLADNFQRKCPIIVRKMHNSKNINVCKRKIYFRFCQFGFRKNCRV